jgi:nitrate reductase gamma subunit
LDTLYHIIMVPMVYLAVAWCILGIAYRVVRMVRAPAPPNSLALFPRRADGHMRALIEAFTWPTILAKQPLFWAFLVAFHVGLVIIFFGHLDLFPQISICPSDSRHMLGAGLGGLLFTAPLLYFMHRRLKEPVRLISVPADYYLLLLLFLIGLTGISISWTNSWNPPIGFVITKAEIATHWFDGLARLSMESPIKGMFVNSHTVVVALHVLLANLFLMILPFSKVMHAFLAVPLNRLRRV